jgi:predicted permease
MTGLRVFVSRLAALVRARRFDDRLNEEIDEHLELATADSIARGMTPEEARLDAVRRFGGITQTRETFREARGFAALDALAQDLRYAIRGYRKSPGFTAIALLTLTLAIGANTAIFSLLNALVLRDLPVRDPDSLVQMTTLNRASEEEYLTFPMFQALAREQRVFSSVVGAWGNSVENIEIGSELNKGLVWAASGNLYGELGIAPAVGRLLVPGDMTIDPPSAAQVVVLGYTYWQRHFHGDPAAIGRQVHIAGVLYTIVGVAPQGFTGVGLTTEPDLTIPLASVPLLFGRSVTSYATSGVPSIKIVGRLQPGVTLDQARAHLLTLWPAVLQAALPPGYTGARRDDFLAARLSVGPGGKGFEIGLRKRFTRPLLIVMSISGLILLIACVNLASLMLSRAAARAHEIGVRLALGASRSRVARQMLTEGVLLSVIGGACGILLAFWICRAMTATIFEEYTVAILFAGTPDGRVVTVTAAVAIATGIVFSLAPAWRAAKESATEALQKQTRAVSGTGRTGRLLVATQIALSLVLVANASLLVRSLAELRAVETGTERSDDVFVAYPGEARPGAFAAIDNDAYYPHLIRRLESIPGVRRASASLLKPANEGTGFIEVVAPIAEPADRGRGAESMRTPISPGFFEAVGIPLIKGRDFTWSDSTRARHVTVISESLARRLFGEANAIGQRVRVGLQPDRQDVEVVGVVADARLYNVKNPNTFAVYMPALQDAQANFKCLVIRASNLTLPAVKREVEALGVEKVNNMVTLRYITNRAQLQERMTGTLAGFFGGLALLLSAIGLYGLMAYSVAQRQREIGIKVALGAEPRRVMREVLRDGLAVTLTGVAVGFAAALATVQLVRSLLFGVTPHDPLTLAAAPASLVAVAIVACLLPAARAARVDPMIALRAE